jgi:hypothetical protein
MAGLPDDFAMEYAEGDEQYFARWRDGLKETGPRRPGLAALDHERRKALGLVLAQMNMVGEAGLAAGQADREPSGARAKGRNRIHQGRDGIASSEFCHA